jgi:imidazolonepropionase-like amidohydrolase
MTRNTKISSWALAAAAAIAAQCLAQPILAEAASEATRPIALKAAHLFDSVSGKMVEHGVVVVSGSKILAVGSDAKIPDDARVIDLGDATLLPGFIDARM